MTIRVCFSLQQAAKIIRGKAPKKELLLKRTLPFHMPPTTPKRPLLLTAAATKGDTAQLKVLLEKNTAKIVEAFLYACDNNQIDSVKLLLETNNPDILDQVPVAWEDAIRKTKKNEELLSLLKSHMEMQASKKTLIELIRSFPKFPQI